MNAPHNDRDPVVAGALRDLDAPPATQEFWDRLDAALDEVGGAHTTDATGAAAEPTAEPTRVPGASRTPGPGTGEVPVLDLRAPREARSSGPRRVLAAAAAVALLLGAVAVVRQITGGSDAGDDAGVVDGSGPAGVTTAPPATASPTTGAPPAPDGTPGAFAEPQSADEAVLRWVDALGRGDAEEAARLLGPGSITYIQSIGSTPAAVMGEMMEGYGSWAGSADRSTTEVTVTSSGEGSVEVVLLIGTRTAEGMEERRVDAIPVRATQGRFRVEPVAFGPGEARIEMISPVPGPDGLGGLAPDGTIELVAPGAQVVTITIDDGDLFAPEVGDDGRVRFQPPSPLGTGTHLLVVASMGPEHLTAFAGTFLVEG